MCKTCFAHHPELYKKAGLRPPKLAMAREGGMKKMKKAKKGKK